MAKIDSPYDELVGAQQITFEMRKFAASSMLGEFARDRMSFDQREIPWMAGLVNTISTEILSRKLADDHYESSQQVPANWWQHLVQDHFPAWYTRRWPAKQKTIAFRIEIERLALYPQADVVVPKNMGHLVIHDIVQPSTGYDDANPTTAEGR